MHILPTTIIATLVFLTSCANSGDHKWSELPGVTSIDSLQETAFVPTLESPVIKGKNVVYAPAFLYAWDKIKQQLNGTISLSNDNSNSFKLINQSTSHKHSLLDQEYSAEVEVVDSVIIARAFFNKTLPFPSKLEKLSEPIVFKKAEVSGVGMHWFDVEKTRFTDILYYKDDDHFVLKLTPKDKEHQILFTKGIENVASLMDAVNQTNDLITLGKKEKQSPKLEWKYTLSESDIFSIPEIEFNISENYKDLEGQIFTTNGKVHYVETAYQRTGFKLNEEGAVVESYAVVTVDTMAAEPIKIHPKNLVLDKPFFIIIKRANSVNPYFVMYVQNAELLKKWDGKLP